MTHISNIARSEGNPKVLRSGPSSLTAPDRLGKALGWFSLGLGLVELLAPHRITRALGMEGQEALVRAYGAREISSGMLSGHELVQARKRTTPRDAVVAHRAWTRRRGDRLDRAAPTLT